MATSLPPLDLHAHTGDVGATPIVEDARVFGQTLTPAEWDDVTVNLERDGLYWGLGLHPIYTKTVRDVDGVLERLSRCVAVGEVGLDDTGLSPLSLEEQREVLIAILTHEETQKRLVSLHALLAYGDVVSLLAEYPTPGAVLHWYSGPGKALEDSIEQDLFYSVNDAIVADPAQAVVLPNLPRHRVLVETDSPYIDRKTGEALNPWEDTEAERATGRSLRSGEVQQIEGALGEMWGISEAEVRLQLWRNLAALESRVQIRPFQAVEVLKAAGHDT